MGRSPNSPLNFLAAETVAGVGDRLIAVMAEVMGHLGIEDAPDKLLGQLLKDAVGTDQGLWLLVVGEELIKQRVGDGVFMLDHDDSGLVRQCRMMDRSHKI